MCTHIQKYQSPNPILLLSNFLLNHLFFPSFVSHVCDLLHNVINPILFIMGVTAVLQAFT